MVFAAVHFKLADESTVEIKVALRNARCMSMNVTTLGKHRRVGTLCMKTRLETALTERGAERINRLK